MRVKHRIDPRRLVVVAPLNERRNHRVERTRESRRRVVATRKSPRVLTRARRRRHRPHRVALGRPRDDVDPQGLGLEQGKDFKL